MNTHRFAFAVLSGGIGARRLAAERLGGSCVFSVEPDAQRDGNYVDIPGPAAGVKAGVVPAHDLLLVGWPGSKELSSTHPVAERCLSLIDEGQPPTVILDAHQRSGSCPHLRELEEALEGRGYHITRNVLEARTVGLPINVKRLFLIASRKAPIALPREPQNRMRKLSEFLDREPELTMAAGSYVLLRDYQIARQEASGLIFCGYRKGNLHKGATYDKMQLSRSHRQQNRIYRSDGTIPQLSAADPAARIWIYHQGRVRRLSLAEAFRLYGFPEGFETPVSRVDGIRGLAATAPVQLLEFVIQQVMTKKLIFSCSC